MTHRRCDQDPPPASTTIDVVIIGSGCGGATAAWDLARAGKEVLVLEEGGDYTGRQLTQRDGAMYDQLYMDRGGRSTSDLSIAILQGRVLGGGGVINASDVVPIPEGVLAHWREAFGLTELTDAAIAPHAARALQDLHANPIREDQLNKNNRVVMDASRKLGLRGEVMHHNREGCLGMGTCLIGCPADAKKNPRFVAIPGAMEAGATFFTRARVVSIGGADQALKTLSCRTLDPKGYHETGTFEVKARTVILAANAIGTAALLKKSGIGNQHVGRGISLQPQLPIMARFPDDQPPLESFYGIPQSFAVTEAERIDEQKGLWGFRIEPVMGTPGIVSSLVPFTGLEGKAHMTAYNRIAASLLLTPDLPTGTVALTGSGRPLVHYALADDLKTRWRSAVKMATKIYLAAGAKTVMVPSAPPLVFRTEADANRVDAFEFAPATAPLLSAHQQGGARMAGSARDGAVDFDGQVWGTRGVYVFDSGWFPSSSSSHTMTPIITMSHYLSARLLAA